MIRIRHLTKHVGTDRTLVLNKISIDIKLGEFVGIVGASGSGKSTFLRCLALKEKWDDGNLMIGSGLQKDLINSITGKMRLRREWAYLEQNPYVNPKRSVLKNVLIGRAGQTPVWRMITGMVRSDDYMGAMDTLEQLGLLDKAHVNCEQLSGGERQRVAIARALVHGANVILADEPVNGLDPAAADNVLETMQELCEQERITVISVLPMEMAERFASRIWGLSGGEIVFDIHGRKITNIEKKML